MKTKSSILFLLASAFLLTLVSCTPPYRDTFNREGKSKGWTQKQTDAAFAFADQVFWSRQVGENKYIVACNKVPTAKVREQLEGVLKDLDTALDPKNADMKQYLDTFNLRPDMEHDEEIAQAVYDRVRAQELQTEFRQKMGDIPEDGPESEMAQGYNIRKIYVNKPLADAFPFSSDMIDAAKKSGTLKQIATSTLDESVQYDHKDPNPKNPDDSNDFVWKARNQKIVLNEYKIVTADKPLDNKGDYIEGYRVLDGKQESKPALKVFFPASGSMALLLVDADEEGMPGFGVPDVIQEISSDTNVQALMRDGALLNSLFDKKEAKKNRTVEQTQLFKIEILPLGGHIDEWQKSPDAIGWVVPFRYATEPFHDNYNVRIHYKKPDFHEGAEGEAHSQYREIDYIAKEYTAAGDSSTAAPGQVIEYYRPKSEFAKRVLAEVDLDNFKKVVFTFEDGEEVSAIITPKANKFIEDKPFAKSYSEGSQRWWIESSNNDNTYDKRKKVAPPKERVGDYPYEEEASDRKEYPSY